MFAYIQYRIFKEALACVEDFVNGFSEALRFLGTLALDTLFDILLGLIFFLPKDDE